MSKKTPQELLQIELDPRDAAAYYGRAEVRRVRGDVEGAAGTIPAVDMAVMAGSAHADERCAKCHTGADATLKRPCESVPKTVDCSICHAERVEEHAALLQGIWHGPGRREELVKQALTAREFYRRDHQYVVQDDKVAIVDEFTGRLMPNRTWRHGLHQAVEAKEGLEVNHPSETLARLSFQRFFRFFRKLSGMTGTAQEAVSDDE